MSTPVVDDFVRDVEVYQLFNVSSLMEGVRVHLAYKGSNSIVPEIKATKFAKVYWNSYDNQMTLEI